MLFIKRKQLREMISNKWPRPVLSTPLDELVLRGYLEKAMGMGEVTVGMAALVELLQQSGNAMPLGPFISLLEQASWEL